MNSKKQENEPEPMRVKLKHNKEEWEKQESDNPYDFIYVKMSGEVIDCRPTEFEMAEDETVTRAVGYTTVCPASGELVEFRLENIVKVHEDDGFLVSYVRSPHVDIEDDWLSKYTSGQIIEGELEVPALQDMSQFTDPIASGAIAIPGSQLADDELYDPDAE